MALISLVAVATTAIAHPRGGGVELVPLAPAKLAHCRKSLLVRAACPTLVPRVRAEYLSHLAVEGEGTPFALATFNLERGGEYPGEHHRNRPPRMGHIVVVGGNVERIAAGVFDAPRRMRIRDGLMNPTRTRSLDLGEARWAGREGRLLLAPSFPRGGMLGNHLLFRWRQQRREYLLSLHAWEPLSEAVGTLRAIVSSVAGS